MIGKLTLQALELLYTASAYNGAQHGEICGKAAIELIEYKKIEEELGIDLITIWKAKTGTFYFKNNLGEVYPVMFQSIDHITKRIHFTILNELDIKNSSAALKDYGKTWALTKDELK